MSHATTNNNILTSVANHLTYGITLLILGSILPATADGARVPAAAGVFVVWAEKHAQDLSGCVKQS